MSVSVTPVYPSRTTVCFGVSKYDSLCEEQPLLIRTHPIWVFCRGLGDQSEGGAVRQLTSCAEVTVPSGKQITSEDSADRSMLMILMHVFLHFKLTFSTLWSSTILTFCEGRPLISESSLSGAGRSELHSDREDWGGNRSSTPMGYSSSRGKRSTLLSLWRRHWNVICEINYAKSTEPSAFFGTWQERTLSASDWF